MSLCEVVAVRTKGMPVRSARLSNRQQGMLRLVGMQTEAGREAMLLGDEAVALRSGFRA